MTSLPQPSARRGVVVLTDEAFYEMSRRPDIVREFPFLSLPRPRASSGCCNGTADQAKSRSGLLQAARGAVASLTTERASRLKELLNCTGLKVFLVQAGGIVEKSL